MFYNCNNLTNLDLTGLNTQNVTSMLDMFGGCRKLTKLDLGAFSTAKVTDMTGMFSGCTALTTIEITDLWTTEAVTESNYMFRNCTSIRGSKGTTYDANYIDKTRAHYDNGPTSDAPGYMTPTATAYVVWDATTKKLTFYYDNLFNDHDNIYFLNTGTQSPTWLTYDIVFGATQAVFDPSFAEARPTSTAYWFAGMQELTKITG
ncbi:MAG: BspA family leucine-rich repeat surface protein, partial [Muribaculaceae bacterium]|nr:BspA family leucine-rich repeat surface protein [Muribaculaceae bacterium]